MKISHNFWMPEKIIVLVLFIIYMKLFHKFADILGMCTFADIQSIWFTANTS